MLNDDEVNLRDTGQLLAAPSNLKADGTAVQRGDGEDTPKNLQTSEEDDTIGHGVFLAEGHVLSHQKPDLQM